MDAHLQLKTLIEAIQSRDFTETRAQLNAKKIDLDQHCGGTLPLIAAVQAGLEYVNALIAAGIDVNRRDGEGNTALLKACERGDVEIVTALLAARADPNVFNGTVLNPLRLAVRTRSPRHLAVVKALVAGGANINLLSRSKSGDPTSTPLIEACRVGNLEAVKELLTTGADVNASVLFGTALTRAAQEGHENIVSLLLAAGADLSFRLPLDPKLRETGGKTAAELAHMNGHARVTELLSTVPAKNSRRHSAGISDAWRVLENVLAGKCPGFRQTLNAGASPEDLLTLAAARAERLPQVLEAFFTIHNGQTATPDAPFILAGDKFFAKFRLMPISEVIQEWQMWNTLLAAGEFRDRQVLADPGIKPDWYNRDWLPLTTDGLGNSHCLDLSPAAGGQIGQIILLWHDQEHRPRVAESLVEWLDDLAADFTLK